MNVRALAGSIVIASLVGAATGNAAELSPFANAFERALFCTVAVPSVAPTLGKAWSAKDLGGRFRHAVDAATAEGHRRGLTSAQVDGALNSESIRQQSMISSGQLKEIVRRYAYCG